MFKWFFGAFLVAFVVGVVVSLVPVEGSGITVDGSSVLISLSAIGKFISVLWAICIIPLVLLSLAGFGFLIQEGGAQAGAEVWAPIMWVLTVGWIGYHLARGILAIFV